MRGKALDFLGHSARAVCCCGCGAPAPPPLAHRGGRAGQRSEGAPDAPAAPASSSRSAGPPVPLDACFLRVDLRRTEEAPHCEICVVARSEAFEEARMESVLDFLDQLLALPDTASGFAFTLDFREAEHMDVIFRVLDWAGEEPRREAWRQRCVRWRVIRSDDAVLGALWALCLSLRLAYQAPPWSVYLATSPEQPCDADSLCYGCGAAEPLRPPQEAAPAPAPALQADAFPQHAFPPHVREAARHLGSSLNVSFAEIQQGFDKSTGLGYLKIFGRDGDHSEEQLGLMMDFMDAFVASENAARGFTITYDLRNLRSPSMTMVMRVAEWGGEPWRQEAWERLNVACKVVVSSGLKYAACKGVLTTFFFWCAPVCRTFLMTDPDQPEETAVMFEPAVPKNLETLAAAAAAAAAARANLGEGQAPPAAAPATPSAPVAAPGQHQAVAAPVPQGGAPQAASDGRRGDEDMFAWTLFFNST